MPNTNMFKDAGSIMGTSFLAIQNALEVLDSRKLRLSDYKIEVAHKEDPKLVVFTREGDQFGVQTETRTELDGDAVRKFLSDKKASDVSDKIDGGNYLAVEAAMEPFRRHKPDIAYYVIGIAHQGSSIIVDFTDKDNPPGTLGSVRERPEFEVEMDANSLKVLRSNFIR